MQKNASLSLRNKTWIKAALVFAIGVALTIVVSVFVHNLQEDRIYATNKALTAEYLHALERELGRKSRYLSSVASQVVISTTEDRHQDIVRKLDQLSYLTTNVSDERGIDFMGFIPLTGGFQASSGKDLITADPSNKKYVLDFLKSQKSLWKVKEIVPLKNETVILGWDKKGSTNARFLVMAHPFFQDFAVGSDMEGGRHYPMGYVVVWVDVGQILKRSWDEKRMPDNLLDLQIGVDTGDKLYVSYQSGLVEVSDQPDKKLIQTPGHSIQFNMLGNLAILEFLSLKTRQGDLFSYFHWGVLVIGVFSTALWSLMAIRVEKYQTSDDSTHTIMDDVSQKLADETAQRRVVEDVLAMNRARWHFIVDNLPVALFAVERSGMFTLGEGRGLSALGLEPGKVEGNSIYEVFKDNPELIGIMRESLSGEERQEMIQINRHWFDIRFSPVVTADGSFDGMICVATDVTGEQNIRARLDKVNLHLRGLMDNVPTGIAFIRGGIIQWNSRALEEIFGYDHDALKGRSPEILYDDVDVFKKLEVEARKDLQERNSFIRKVLFRRPDKSRFMAEITGRLVDWSNTRAGTLWVIQDLTRYLEDEKERRLSKTVFDNVVEGVMVMDSSKDIIQINKAFSSITGYRESDVLGQKPALLKSDKHDESFFENMWDVLDQKGEWEGEMWNRRKNGQTYLSWMNISVLRDEQGNVEEYVSVFNDITSHRETQEQLNYQSNYDLLTGLPNRHLLADRFTQVAAQAKREQKSFSLIYMDLDNFKYLNESLGLEVGDFIIKTIAQRLDKTLRSVDTVARISGDEFIILLVGAGGEEAASRVVGNLAMAISQPIEVQSHEDDILMSASCGIALYPKDGTSLAELTPKAEAAMHRAKEIERGLFMFFTEDMNTRAQERLQLETKLRKALDNDEFELYYQPKVHLETGEVFGAEALIRWNNPELGMVGPDRFIPIAEETGLIVPIGEWVFKTACQQLKKWQDGDHQFINVAVNLSGRQFTKPDLAHDLISIINDSEIDPSSLEVEITESFIASSETGVVDALNLLSNIGVQLSVDDFGTGYSSLNYLHRFPLDIMKIDRSFIMHIGEESQEATTLNLAKAVIAIAKSMNLKIVGEGVETEAQLTFLRENGCDLMQGYYFSKPLPVGEFENLLKSKRTL
ncbi:MAG: EAL domain-containing protein [Methylocystaceae bacterium]|nr:EAL domain-containing protein [Methylocystaceae bacterium]